MSDSELPRRWAWRTPEELAAAERNSLAIGPFGSNLKVSDYRPSGTPLVFVRNIRSGDFKGNNPQFVSSKKAAELAAHRVDPGDILITKMGEPPGDAHIYPANHPPAIITADCIKFRPDASSNSKFLALAIISPAVRAQIKSRTKGVAQQKISLETFRTLRLPIAPRAEQDRIVAEIEKQFTRLDAGVEALKRLQAHLRRYRAAVLNAACQGSLTGSPASREAPATVVLSDLAEIQLGQQRAPVHANAAEQFPYLRAANITWNGLDLSDIKTMGFPNRARYRLQDGDVILVEASGSPMEAGKPAIWRGQLADCYYQKTLLRIRPRRPDVLPEYLYVWFLNDAVSGKFARMAPGVGIVHLTAERLRAWPVWCPSATVQRRIVATYQQHASQIEAATTVARDALRRAESLRRAILERAFSGRLRSTH